MKKDKHIIKQQFSTFEEMEQSARNWNFKNIYKLLPHADTGTNHIVFLPDMQLTYSENDGGILFDVKAPKGMISVAVIETCKGKACFDETKLKEGMVVFSDDKKARTLITNDKFKVAIFSFSKKAYKEMSKRLANHTGDVIEDTDDRLKQLLSEALETFLNDPKAIDDASYKAELQNTLITQLETLLETQNPKHPKLTRGERIALEIRDRVYRKMNAKISIGTLAEEFNISEQTLQNAFKSLFGFTPNIFIRHIKLNHVCKALQKADASEDTIIRISKKWGFTHMGHFSRYFTQLFGENPSVTLGRTCSIKKER
jgi:AraC-like DNA-binding protein